MRQFYIALAAIAVVGVGTVAYLSNSGPDSVVVLPADLVPGEASGYVIGSPDAKVELVEYGDFECPGCGQFANVTGVDIKRRLVDEGLVRFRFVDFPLTEIHPHALSAHVAAACGDEQSRFWEMHDALFAGQNEWNAYGTKNPKKVFLAYAGRAGMDVAAWEACYDERRPLQRILANRAEGERLGVPSTPTFRINNVMLPGGLSYDRLKAIVDSIGSMPQTKAAGGN
jgi:protein-disulfide isomerase